MQGHLTYSRIINLITVYFYNNDWMDQTTDYVKEKYNHIFNCLPDKIKIIDNKIIYPETISNETIKRFYTDLIKYRKKWNLKKDGLTKIEIILLFTVYHLSSGYLNPYYLERRYSDLFTTFDFINNHSQVVGLHDLIKQVIQKLESEREQEFLPYKRVSKLLKIKRQMEKE